MKNIYILILLERWISPMNAANKDVKDAIKVVNEYYTNLTKYMADVESNLGATFTIIDHCVSEHRIEVQNDLQDFYDSQSASWFALDTYFTLIEEIANPDGEIKEKLRMDYRILKTELIETPVYNKKNDRPYNYISVLVEKKIFSKRHPQGKRFREQAKYEVDLGRINSIRSENFDNMEHEIEVVKDISKLKLFADEFYTRKKYDLAYKAYQRIVELENGDKDAYYRLGLMLLKHQGGNGLTSKQKDEEALNCFSLAIKTIYSGCVLPVYYEYDKYYDGKRTGFRVKRPNSYRYFVSDDYQYYNRDIDARIALILFNILEIENTNLQSIINYQLNVRRASYIDGNSPYLSGRENIWAGAFLNRSYPKAKEHYFKPSKVELKPHIDKNKKWGYVNNSHEIVIPCKFNYAGEFNEGLAPVSVGDKYGYINEKGKLVIDAVYDDACVFSHRRAAVRIGTKYGYISPSGLMIIIPEFDAVTPFFHSPIEETNAWAVVKKGDLFKINTKGEIIAKYTPINEGENDTNKGNKAYWKTIK